MAKQGRSVYLTNKQWFALSDYINDELLDDIDERGVREDLTAALKKLQKIADEVTAERGGEQ